MVDWRLVFLLPLRRRGFGEEVDQKGIGHGSVKNNPMRSPLLGAPPLRPTLPQSG